MPEVVFSVDQSKSMRDQAVPGHNRWHSDLPPAANVRPGQQFSSNVSHGCTVVSAASNRLSAC